MLKVGQRPQLIKQMKHNLSFVSDEKINNRILTKYRLYEYLTPCDPDNIAILQDIINEWSDYTNKLYETTKYEYNPIENYDRIESATDNEVENSSASGNSNSTLKSAGMESNNMADTNKTESDSSANSNRNNNKTHNARIHGNVGTMSTQSMIMQERDIIIDVLDFYVGKFANAFNITMEVNRYGCM